LLHFEGTYAEVKRQCTLQIKIKEKFTLEQAMKAQRGKIVFYSFFNLRTKRAGGWSMPCPSHLTPGKKTQYPLYRRLGWSQGWSGQVGKISSSLWFDNQTVQPAVSHYTDYTVLAITDT
jgi:hypothetical protein